MMQDKGVSGGTSVCIPITSCNGYRGSEWSTERKLAWPAVSGTCRSDSETVRTLSDMVMSVEGRQKWMYGC